MHRLTANILSIKGALLMLGFAFLPGSFASEASALKNENLLVGLPQGYKMAYQTRVKNMKITEMIPQSQSLKNWSEMVTVQIFLNDKKLSPIKFFHLMRSTPAKACKGSRAILIKKGFENGYAFSFFFLICPLNTKTKKPEYTWFKTIRGKDSFYVVQKAWKKKPAKSSIVKWTKYLRRVSACDTRKARHKCPAK